MRRTLGQSNVQVRMRFDRVINNSSAGILLRAGPDGETKSASGFQNAACFRTRLFGTRDVEQTEVNQNPVKTAVSKRKILSVALQERYVGGHFLRDRDHILRKINSTWNSAQLFRCGRYI